MDDLADILKVTEHNVALAFRAPQPLLPIGAYVDDPAELVMLSWFASGLGFAMSLCAKAD